MIPLFKKGSRYKNYRPVSLTSVICKLLERLIKDNLVDFLVKHNLINTSQYEFLKGRSCLTNMVDIAYIDLLKPLTKCHIKGYYAIGNDKTTSSS